jgi:hypothetical protein
MHSVGRRRRTSMDSRITPGRISPPQCKGHQCAVTPILARLNRVDNGMVGAAEVLRRVLSKRRIAASDMPALKAQECIQSIPARQACASRTVAMDTTIGPYLVARLCPPSPPSLAATHKRLLQQQRSWIGPPNRHEQRPKPEHHGRGCGRDHGRALRVLWPRRQEHNEAQRLASGSNWRIAL